MIIWIKPENELTRLMLTNCSNLVNLTSSSRHGLTPTPTCFSDKVVKKMWSSDNYSSVNPTLVAGFLLGGFIPTCHAQAFAEMTKLEKIYGMEMQTR
jgi:hypothetical protein